MAKEELTKNRDTHGGKVGEVVESKGREFHLGSSYTSSKAEEKSGKVRTEKTSLMIWGWGEERPHYSSLKRE